MAVNPVIAQLIGPIGLAEIIRGVLEGLDFDSSQIIPDKEDLRRAMMMQQQ